MDPVARKLEKLMIERDVTQAQLAEKAGLTKGFISHILTGRRQGGRETLNKICNALNISIADLFNDKEIPVQNNAWLPVLTADQIADLKNTLADTPDNTLQVDYQPVSDKLPIDEYSFIYIIENDCLAPMYNAGDQLIFAHETQPQPGDVVIAKVADILCLGVYRKRAGEAFEVAPVNPNWPTELIADKSVGEVMGVMIEGRKRRKAT